jgi:hypothetical protein
MADDITPEFIDAVSKYTDVPAFLLSGDTAAAVWESAQRAVDWKTSTAPRPATAAVSAASPPPRRIPVQQLVPGDDWLSAWRSGRLTPMGAPQPPPRRSNGHSRHNGP